MINPPERASIELSPVEALRLLLDQVDYQEGACTPTEMVGAVLSVEVLAQCRRAARTKS